jgi:hypothetical protein
LISDGMPVCPDQDWFFCNQPGCSMVNVISLGIVPTVTHCYLKVLVQKSHGCYQ